MAREGRADGLTLAAVTNPLSLVTFSTGDLFPHFWEKNENYCIVFTLVETGWGAARVADISINGMVAHWRMVCAMKNKTSRKKSQTKSQPKKLPRSVRAPLAQSHTEALDALGERLDMMLPEVMARIAAVEHVLIEKKVCSLEDLLRARQFIDEQESF